MPNDNMRALLLQALELIGVEWEETKRPEDIRLREKDVMFLLTVKALARAKNSGLTGDDIRGGAPTFADQFQQVMMQAL